MDPPEAAKEQSVPVKLIRSRPKRLVMDGSPLTAGHFSGIGHYTLSLFEALDEVLAEAPDREVRLAVPRDQIPHMGTFGFRRIRPLAFPVPMSNVTLRRLVAEGRLPRMDLLLGRGTYFFPNYARWPLAWSPSITAIHDLSFEKVPELVDGPNGEHLRVAVRNSIERSDLISALSYTMADEIADHYEIDRARVHVVGCAADTGHFYRRSEREVTAVKSRYGLFGDYLMAVGNIEPRKNQIRLIDAFCALPRELADRYTLVLVGAGAWKEDAIRTRIDAAVALGFKIKLLLHTVSDQDLPALYTGATCSVYVSVYEGFGMPPLESMACRTPVISSNRSVMPEVAGDAALLVDPEDQGAITDALATMLSLDEAARDEWVQRGLRNVDRYDWHDAARALLAAAESLEGA